MLEKLKVLQTDLLSLKKSVKTDSKNTINKKSIRDSAEELGTRWFSEFSAPLMDLSEFSPEQVEVYSQSFGRLIKISAPNNLKSSYLDTLDKLTKCFRTDWIIPIQTAPKVSVKASMLSVLLEGLDNEAEDQYFQEAIDCAKHNFYRAAAVLGWCAAIDRVHDTIEKEGFAKFNIASAAMASQTKGRFKRFTSTQNVTSISELREVFDTVILWILEGMNFIDSNQHTRLRSCFDLRCQCAHPGDAPITEYNLLSFYSDINEIIFKNPKFKR